MAKDIYELLDKNLLTPFKRYKTSVQDTLFRVIGDRLQNAYDLTENYTETMLTPDNLHPEIIQAKASQYDFNIREEASLSEQNKLLEAVNVTYSKRGSIESIENMWKHYGGNLPKDVTVEIPSESLFRYSLSKLSGNEVFQDGGYNRSGIYNVSIEGNYSLKSLRDFLNNEFVAAGTQIGYIMKLHYLLLDGSTGDLYCDNVYKNIHLEHMSMVYLTRSGLTWSSRSIVNTWSGQPNLFIDIIHWRELDAVIGDILVYERTVKSRSNIVLAARDGMYGERLLNLDLLAICTPIGIQSSNELHFYNIDGEEIISRKQYKGYFVLGESLLNELIE